MKIEIIFEIKVEGLEDASPEVQEAIKELDGDLSNRFWDRIHDDLYAVGVEPVENEETGEFHYEFQGIRIEL